MAVAGLRGSGSWSSDERPKNYRDSILFMYPNTPAALTALTGKMRTEVTDDAEFKIFEKTLPQQDAIFNSATSTATTIVTTTAADAKIFKAGHVIRNVRTQEVLWVTTDGDGSTGNVVVERAKDSTAAAFNSADVSLIVGTAHREGAGVPTAITYDPSVVTNYTQIFRTSYFITGTASETRLRTGVNPKKELKRETLELHGIEMEKAFIWSTFVEDTSGGAQPKRTTRGILKYITTNVKDFAGPVTEDAIDDYLRDVFRYGSREKICFLGANALNVFNKVAKRNSEMNIVPGASAYGMALSKWDTPFGTLYFRQHPLFSESAEFTSWGVIIDAKKLVYRPMKNRDTKFLEGRQNNGDDAMKDEWLTEAGLELQHQKCHGYFSNADTFAA